MPNVRFNESFTPSHPPKNARPREDSTTSLNRAFALSSSADSTAQSSSSSTMQQYHSISNTSTDAAVFGIRNGHCAKCNHPFGKITNRFRKVTGSYYQHLDENALGRVDLRPEGATKELGPKNNQALEGCIVQGLTCTSCTDRFAFQCVSAPNDKLSFKHRLFFKLDHIHLVDTDTGSVEQPFVEADPASAGQAVPRAGSPAHDDTLSPSPTRANMPSVEHPDYEAARGIMAKEPWSTVHEQWERRTHERLSPSTFGKRILPVVHEIQSSHRRETRSHSRDSSEVRPIASGRSIPQANGISQAESTRHRYQDSMEAQRNDINRLEATLSNVQAEISQMKGLLAEMRYEITSGPRRPNGGPEDSSTLDSLADQVNRVASRAGEIDGLRFELTALKGKLKRVEDVVPPTPSQSHTAIPRSESTAPPPPPSRHQDIAPRGWNAVNTTTKRKSVESSPVFIDSKRPRTEYHTATRDSMPSYGPHIATAPPPQPPPPPALAPIRSNSQESWQPEAQRLPPIRGMHSNGRGSVRPPPSRLNPTHDVGVVDWDRDLWDQKQVDLDSYHRPLGNSSRPPLSPGAAKRGNLIRRGTSGGAAPLQYVDPGPTKRTRQRPVRNEHGILIRKDGKPDQRSISSPQNLRKVHERRLQEQDKGSQDDDMSPVDTDGPRSTGAPNSAIESSGSGSPGLDQISPVEPPDSRPPSDTGSRPISRHEKVMHKMFPHGLTDDRHRVNHAAHIFDDGSQQHRRAELRHDMERNEAHEQDEADKDAVDIEMPRGRVTQHEKDMSAYEQASGSVYEPSQTQPQTQALDDSKGITESDSVDPSSSKIASIKSRTTQDSDNRPLRVRELAESGDEREESGSMYERSPTEEASVK